MEAANGDHIEADFPNIQAVSICLLELQSCARHIGGSIRKIFYFKSQNMIISFGFCQTSIWAGPCFSDENSFSKI